MTGRSLRPALLSTGAAVALGIVASCARQGAPPGGPQDRLPPEVVTTRPDTFAVLEVVRDPIRIGFSERISELPTSGTLNQSVLVSPRTGEIRVSHKRDALEVDLSGGFRSGVAYRVTVLPVVKDLFGNAMPEPFEFVFTTGGEYTPNAVAGLVVDRITGRMVQDAEVAAYPDWTDTLDLVYVSRTDSAGIFALRYLPPGRYRLLAFQDRDRDGEADPFEIQGERLVPLGATDTILSDVVILQPDTSAARLAQAALEDSTRVGLTFDDYLDPLAPLDGVQVSLEPVPDTTEEGITTPPPPPNIRRILHDRQYQAWVDSVAEVRAREDSLAAVAAADSAVAAGDSAAVAAADSAAAAARAAAARQAEGAARVPRPGDVPLPPGQLAPPGAVGPGGAGRGAEPRALPDGTPLPAQRLVLVLDGPIPHGTTYRISMEGVVNVNGLGGGGGEVTFTREEAPPDTAVADTTNVLPPDTGAAAPPDTGGVAGDGPSGPPWRGSAAAAGPSPSRRP